MFNKMSTKRKIVAGLGLVGFVGAVVLIQNSSDMSKWSNFGANVGLSIGVSVFVWFLTDDLRERLSRIADLQVITQTEIETLKGFFETPDIPENQRGILDQILKVLSSLAAQLSVVGHETEGILDGVLTALEVKLDDSMSTQNQSSIRPSGGRWNVRNGSHSVNSQISRVINQHNSLSKPIESLNSQISSVNGKVQSFHTLINEATKKITAAIATVDKAGSSEVLVELQNQLNELVILVQAFNNAGSPIDPPVAKDSE